MSSRGRESAMDRYNALMMEWPEWWNWELEFSPHLLKRMIDRGFSQTDLREMLELADGFQVDADPDRFAIFTHREQVQWVVIVEPDQDANVLVVITAFPVI